VVYPKALASKSNAQPAKPKTALHALIAAGETARVEFKSTMRMNLKTGKKGKEIELAWLKSAVAFMNSQGGVLLIGVDDRGAPLGLEADRFDSEDKCRLHLKNLLKQHIGLEFTKYIQFDIIDYLGRRVLIVECAPSREPVFLIEPRDEGFYIRSGPSSVKLSSRQVLQYLKRR
jgi:predicted HTH transcriptional regulator